jgi:hypothetical protein
VKSISAAALTGVALVSLSSGALAQEHGQHGEHQSHPQPQPAQEEPKQPEAPQAPAAAPEHAEHAPEQAVAASPHASGEHHAQTGALGSYPMTRESSGTAWQPDTFEHMGVMGQSGD